MSNEFNTGDPVAYFLTWTTYGTWLPGDDRGFNRKDEADSLEPNWARHQSALADMKEPSLLLSHSDRELVEATVRKHCEIRDWELHALSARTNHVHVVVTAPATKPEAVVSQFKAWCTRLLKAQHPERERFWTQGASTRWINQQSDLATAIDYTLEAQDRKGVE